MPSSVVPRCATPLRRALLAMSLVLLLPLEAHAADGTGEKPAPPAESARSHVELGSAYFGVGKLDAAFDEAQKAITLDANLSSAQNLLALVKWRWNDPAGAEAAFQKAVALDPKDGDSWNNYGQFQCDQGRAHEGITSFGHALTAPRYANQERTLVNAGRCLDKAGEHDAAIKYYLASLQVGTGTPWALTRLAENDLATGALASARARIDRALSASAPDALTLDVAARVYFAQHANDGATLFVRRLRRDYPDSPEAQRWITAGIGAPQ